MARADRDVVLVDQWHQHLGLIRERGLSVSAIGDDFVAYPRVLSLEAFMGDGEFDALIIAAKSYDTAWIADLARKSVTSNGFVMSAQNGMNEARLVDVFGPKRVLGCVVPMAAELESPARVRRTSGEEWGTLILGDLTGSNAKRVDAAAEYLEPLGGISTTEHVERALWGKLTLNVMSNGLAGLTGFTTHNLWTDPRTLDCVVALGHEVAALASAVGAQIDPVLGTVSQELLALCSEPGLDEWTEVKAHIATVGATRSGARENVPSLLQDIRRGRRTEIDYLNGWIVSESSKVGLAAALNAAIVGEVHDLELRGIGPVAEPLENLLSRLGHLLGP